MLINSSMFGLFDNGNRIFVQGGRARSALCGIVAITLVLGGCTAQRAASPPATSPPMPPDTSFGRAVPQFAERGMVVSAHPLASAIGRDALAGGGNAIDATLATLAALNVVEPHASGLGGGGFLLYYDAAADSFVVIDYRERAPRQMQRAVYFQAGDTLRLKQRSGATAVLTPGAPAGWQAMHRRYGTRLLRDLFAPAITLADTGYPVSEKQSAMILDHYADLAADPALAAVFLADSLPLMPGARLTQPKLAQTLRFLAGTRLENLYHPPLSTALVNTVRGRGGMLSAEDLQSYQVRDRRPLRGTYHGYEIITLPPPASGGTALLEILSILEPLDLRSMGHHSAELIHAVAGASRQALKDANTWIADPEFAPVPARSLLADDWISEARQRALADSVPEKLTALDSLRALGPGNTTHVVVVDSAGNLASLTQSINYFFGAGLMVDELGLLLNNHMADFNGDTVSAAGIAPLRRPPSNMAPTIVRKNGKPVLIIGSPGGSRIAPVLAQVLIDVLDFEMPLHEALNAPRFFPANRTLVVETRIPDATLTALAAKGWKIYPYGSLNTFFGGVHAVQIDPETRRLTGAADPRRDGAPVGY